MSTPNSSSSASGREELELLLVSNLPLLDRITCTLAHRNHLVAEDAEEFHSWVIAHLIADDYRVLAKFRGEASLGTYLTAVASSLLRDYRHAEHGRWRSSATALRAGAVAIRLEQLVVRDGLPLRQAAEMMRSSAVTTQTDAELARMAATFPRRGALRPVHYTADVESCFAAEGAHDLGWSEDPEDPAAYERILMDALTGLQNDERELIRLVYWKRMSIADAARTLHTPQKPLYRRLERILGSLRREIESKILTVER